MKKIINISARAFMTGVMISVGCSAFLSCENTYFGAFLFGLGLFTILNFGFYLYTGKVGYIVNEKPSYIIDVALIWLGNLIGVLVSAFALSFTRTAGNMAETAAALCDVKTADNPLSAFVLAFFCGLLMFIAADGFKTIKGDIGRAVIVFLPIMAFIISGFEHSIADMFYFSIAKKWSLDSAVYVIIVTLGNAFGGMLIPFVKKAFKEESA